MTKSLILSNLFSEPLFTLYTFISFILYKDLGAGAFEVTLLTMLKPLVTVLSFYWGANLVGKTRKLKTNVLWAGFWMRAPFLLCPWVHSSSYVIFAAVVYMFFYRAALPAWLEIVRRNLEDKERSRSFSLSSALAYAEGVILSFAFGALLDHHFSLWKGLFFGSALIGLLSLWVQARIRLEGEEKKSLEKNRRPQILEPWKDSFQLMRKRKDFARFQWGFMLAGFGLMLIQPAIPLFAVDVLGISYMEITTALCVAKGLGFVLSSQVWARRLEKSSAFRVAAMVFIWIGLFPVLLSLSVYSHAWLYIAYFFYGIGQGGSHLVWNLSGPIFAGKEDSSRFSGVGVVMGGIRGLVAPPLGGLLTIVLGPIQVLIAGGALCLYSASRFLKKQERKVPLPLKP